METGSSRFPVSIGYTKCQIKQDRNRISPRYLIWNINKRHQPRSPIPETRPIVNISVSTTLFHPRQTRKGSEYRTCPLSKLWTRAASIVVIQLFSFSSSACLSLINSRTIDILAQQLVRNIPTFMSNNVTMTHCFHYVNRSCLLSCHSEPEQDLITI